MFEPSKLSARRSRDKRKTSDGLKQEAKTNFLVKSAFTVRYVCHQKTCRELRSCKAVSFLQFYSL